MARAACFLVWILSQARELRMIYGYRGNVLCGLLHTYCPLTRSESRDGLENFSCEIIINKSDTTPPFRNRNCYFRKVCEPSARMLIVLLLSRLSPAVRATSTARACLAVVNICNLCHGIRLYATFDKLSSKLGILTIYRVKSIQTAELIQMRFIM